MELWAWPWPTAWAWPCKEGSVFTCVTGARSSVHMVAAPLVDVMAAGNLKADFGNFQKGVFAAKIT